MRYFRRKAAQEDEGERCPQCGERMAERTDVCVMCGADLRPLHASSPRAREEAPKER